jgi:protein-S-isoprenylcysteine O-methyltransferase Ste14
MEDDDKVKRVREHVRRIKSFYSGLITFVVVNILLLVINFITNPHSLWFYWVTLIWGAVLVIQAINLFTIRDRFLGAAWEEKKTRELLDKEEKKNKL